LLAGSDVFAGAGVAEDIQGGNGRDSIAGNGGNDTIIGGAGSDTLVGGAGDDTINGNDGNDSIAGSADNDSIDGGFGADTINAGSGDETVFGGLGDDVIYVSGSVTASDNYQGQGGDDTFILDTNNVAGTDIIDGGSNEDTLKLEGSVLDFNFSDNGTILENAASGAIANIEVLQVDGVVNSVALNIADVIDMTDSNNELDVILDGSSVTLNLDDNLVDTGQDEFRDGHTFSKYTGGGATVFVANDEGASINSVSGLV
ncbi:MAG: calcium-binding protein, partial [Pseudomonadota bacterium]